MKRIVPFLFIYITISLFGYGQNSTGNDENNKSTSITKNKKNDILIKKNGERMYVIIEDVGNKYINFVYPGERQVRGIKRSEVKDIIYSSNNSNNPSNEITLNSKIKWRKVIVTKDEKDVEGMTKKGVIIGVGKGSNRGYSTARSLELNAITILKKKAAELNADFVLITNKDLYRGYGDIPRTTLEGIAYSSRPTF